MATSETIHSDLAIPPGEYLAEVIDDLGMSQAELARRMGRPAQAINEIVGGTKAITPETAIQLERVTNVPAHIWTGLEQGYRLVLARQAEEDGLREEAKDLDANLYRAMAKFGWVAKHRQPADKVRELRHYFGVASLSLVKDAKVTGYAFRVAKRDAAAGFALAAWLRHAEVRARELRTAPYREEGLRTAIAQLRSMTLQEPEAWLSRAESLIAAQGVALVLQPHLPKTFANGAAFWTARDKAVVVLSLRGKWADIVWFSLFHELGHVLLHPRQDPHVTGVESTSSDPALEKQEREADAFAADHLIPRRAYEQFVMRGDFSERAVATFSEGIDVAPGIVVGRLQHAGHVRHHQLNDLRERYEFAP